ncbi:hypothetical protein [Sediminitomix flava]|uniref:Copper chaperone CopZ n=1 Tax=Sediminitomix flava TaxID=379075 RepID=A0A315ZA85_SEDFL|nr:hypothetical protein [Sediminitomix flava]PWJ41973.1 hypothetical protein BC781_103223 [Sediminitomix flava]
MKNLLFLHLLIFLGSCIQLEEKEFKLEYACESCKETLEHKLLSELKGVHYSKLNRDSGILRLKVDPKEFDLECLFHFLEEEGFSRENEKPLCCLNEETELDAVGELSSN